MKKSINKELNQRGDNAILFIAMATFIVLIIVGYVRFIFF